MQKRNRDIEETFREYQEECKSRERTLVSELEKAHVQIKGSDAVIENLAPKWTNCRSSLSRTSNSGPS